MQRRDGLVAELSESSVWGQRLARRTAGQDGFLTGILALANAEGVINFSGGFPDPELFPTDALGDIVARAAGTTTRRWRCSTRRARASCRCARRCATSWSTPTAHRPAADELMITSGGIDAVTLIAKSMLDPGDVVVVEEPSYLGAVSGFAGFDAVDCAAWRWTTRGCDVDALAAR